MVKRKAESDKGISFGDAASKFERGQEIMEGKSSSRTFMAKLRDPADPPLEVVVKSSVRCEAINEEYEKHRTMEMCPFIRKCYGIEITWCLGAKGKAIPVNNLLLEFAPQGNLADLIKSCEPGGLPEIDVRRFTRCILEGLFCLHESGFVLTSLNAEEILIFASETMGGSRIAKIGNLEAAERVNRDDGPLQCSSRFARDVQDLGRLVLVMLLGKSLSDRRQRMEIENLAGKIAGEPRFPGILESVSDEGKGFLKWCFLTSVGRTPLSEMLRCHPFVIAS